MARIHKENKKIILEGFNMSLKNEMYLDCGESIDVDVKISDKRRITDQQRRFIFALFGDYEDYTGDDSEMIRAIYMREAEEKFGIDVHSITEYSMTDANHLIDYTILKFIANGIPIKKKTIDENDYQFNDAQIYVMALKRICCVCGRVNSDLHHLEHIARRGIRSKAKHEGLSMIPLCRIHHTEAHTIGDKAIVEKYHLSPFVIDKRMEHFIKKGVIKVHKEDEDEDINQG